MQLDEHIYMIFDVEQQCYISKSYFSNFSHGYSTKGRKTSWGTAGAAKNAGMILYKNKFQKQWEKDHGGHFATDKQGRKYYDVQANHFKDQTLFEVHKMSYSFVEKM